MSETSLGQKLLELLSEIDFGKRYFAYYELHKSREGADTSLLDRHLESALSQTGVDFVYNEREHFFRHKEDCNGAELSLGAALLYGSSLEFLMYLRSKDGVVGGPFPKLARDVCKLRDPSFDYNPRSPKLPVSDEDDLQEAVRFGIALFQEAKNSLCSFQGWGKGKARKARNRKSDQ